MKNKAKNISYFVLWVIISLSLIVACSFYFGGEVPETQRLVYDLSQPSFTDLLLFWMLFLLALSFGTILAFGIYHHLKDYDDSPKRRTLLLTSIAGGFVVLCAFWLLGDGTPLKISGYEGSFNTSFWLKTASMWINTICLLLLACVALVVSFKVRDYLIHKKER